MSPEPVISETWNGGEGGIRSRNSRSHQQFRPVFNRSNRQNRSKPEYQVQNRYSEGGSDQLRVYGNGLLSARSSKRSLMATPSLNRHHRSAAYSQRKATIGSARIARRAGTQHANSADAARSRITPANVSGSVGLVS